MTIVSKFSRSIWVLFDQGVVSAGTFLSGLILARHLPPQEYGAYALVLSVMLAANSLQAALVSYPLMARGAALDASRFTTMVRSAVLLQAALSIGMGLMLAIGTWACTGDFALAVGAAVSLFAWQLQQTTRGALQAKQRYKATLPGDTISYLTQAAIVGIAIMTVDLSLSEVFAIIAVTSFTAAIVQLFQIGIADYHYKIIDRQIWQDFWSIGKWVLLTNGATSLSMQAFVWGLSIFHGPGATARYQALGNVLGLTHPILISLSAFTIPAVALVNAEGSHAQAMRVALLRALPMSLLMIPICLFLMMRGRLALSIMYGPESPYTGLAVPLGIISASYLIQFIIALLNAYLNGIERPQAAFTSNLVGASVAAVVGIPLAATLGVLGASIGAALMGTARMASLWMAARSALGPQDNVRQSVRQLVAR